MRYIPVTTSVGDGSVAAALRGKASHSRRKRNRFRIKSPYAARATIDLWVRKSTCVQTLRRLSSLATAAPIFDNQIYLRKRRRGAATDPPGGNAMKYLLLLIPCVVALWVPLFNSVGPELFGIPFFYWFQLLLVPVSALAIFAADRVGKA